MHVFELARCDTSSLQSPGSLYIGGQALKLTGIPERIFDLYTQPHLSNSSTSSHPPALKLHAIVSQSLKVPLSLSDNLVDKLHNRTVTEEKERLKRGLVRIDAPVSQPGAKKRKLSPARAGGVLAGGARPAGSGIVTLPARPTPPVVKTLAGPPLSAQSLAPRQRRNEQPASASASDSSSSSSQPLAQAQLPSAALNGTFQSSSTAPSPTKSSFPSSANHQGQSKPNSSASSSTPAHQLPSDTTPRGSTDGWKTSNFKGGMRSKANTPTTKTKSVASSVTPITTTKASRSAKPSPLATPNDRDDFPDSAPRASSSSSKRNQSPLTIPPLARASGSGLKRSRDVYDASSVDVDAADDLLLALVEDAPQKKKSAVMKGTTVAPGRSGRASYGGVDAHAEIEAVAAGPPSRAARKGDGVSIAPNVASASSSGAGARRSRVSNLDLDDDLLETAAGRPSLSAKSSSATAAVASGTKARPRPGSAKASYDDQDWDARDERRQAKRLSTAAASRPTSAADGVNSSYGTAGNQKARKSALSRESPIPSTAATNGYPTTSKSSTVAGKVKARAPAPSDLVSTMVGNGTSNGARVNTRTVSHPTAARSAGAAPNDLPSSSSSRPSKANHTNGSTTGSRLKKRASPIYSDDTDDDPPLVAKVIPIPTKLKPTKIAAGTTGTGTVVVPPSPVSQTASSSRANRPSASQPQPTHGVTSSLSSKKKAKRDAEDRTIDVLISTPLPQGPNHDRLREHYESCYVTYIALWGRLRGEIRKQEAMLRKRISHRSGSGDEEGEVSSAASSSDEHGDGGGEGGESYLDVEALHGRYRRLHDRLQTIRDTLGG